jgi:hypothetical protein
MFLCIENSGLRQIPRPFGGIEQDEPILKNISVREICVYKNYVVISARLMFFGTACLTFEIYILNVKIAKQKSMTLLCSRRLEDTLPGTFAWG